MIRKIVSHLHLFALVLILLVIVSWFKRDTLPRKVNESSPGPLPKQPYPILKPITRTKCLNINDMAKSLNRVRQMSFHRVPQLQLYLFSAYLDLRMDKGHVLLIGTASNFSETYEIVKNSIGYLICLIVDGRRVTRIIGSVDVESGFYGVKTTNTAILIRCPLRRIPSSTAKVGVIFNYCDSPTFFLPIQHIPKKSRLNEGVEVCVDPLTQRYSNGTKLIDFIELHRSIGVKHFTFYVQNLEGDAGVAMDYYVKEGVVTLVPWHTYPHFDEPILNISSSDTSPGLRVAIQDCLYRQMSKQHPFTLFLNTNDAIVPNSSNYSLTTLVKDYLSYDIGRSGLRIRRSSEYGNQMNSQWIIKSHAILSMKSHWVGKYLRGRGFDVPQSVALIRSLHNWNTYVTNEAQKRALHDRIMSLHSQLIFKTAFH